MKTNITYGEYLSDLLPGELNRLNPDRVFVLSDNNSYRIINARHPFGDSRIYMITIASGEQSKNIAEVEKIWEWLTAYHATRRSVMVNVGGGVVTDLGGFAASTYKRGMRFLNVPTTIVGAADAAIGGKTGINFNGEKNLIGVFAQPESVLIASEVFASLPKREVLSGFAEVVKMALLTSPELYHELLNPGAPYKNKILWRGIRHAADAKVRVVDADPTEKGLRRILNLGHTAGHAFEMLSNARGPGMSHGEAVAHGILTALRLSEILCGFPEEEVQGYKRNILERYYKPLPFENADKELLLKLMSDDKKNPAYGLISFTLLESVGKPVESFIVDPELIADCLF